MSVNGTGALLNLERGKANRPCGYCGQVLRMMERHGLPRIARQPEHHSREVLMTIHFLPPKTDLYDAAVEDAIATCNGDLRGALKALLILNEHLEAELVELQAAIRSTHIAYS
jgi:hypothetical protein